MEVFSLKGSPREFRIALLRALGLGVDETKTFVIAENGTPVVDPFIGKQVKLDNMAIFPGSTIVLDDNPISIASYMEKYGEVS